jgi:hypothetical protein
MVYVVQEPEGKNILAAKKFGKLEALLPSGQIMLSSGPSVLKLRRKLQKFCDDDYLLLIGDPIAIALAAMIAGASNAGRVKFLKWDKQERQYYPVEVDIYRRMDEKFS